MVDDRNEAALLLDFEWCKNKLTGFDLSVRKLLGPSMRRQPERDEVAELEDLAKLVADHDVVDDELVHVHDHHDSRDGRRHV